MTHLTIQQLVAQTDGELGGPSLKLVEKHIAECESCWHEMEQLAEQDALLASVVSIDPGDAFFEELSAEVEAAIYGKKKPPRVAASLTGAPAPEHPVASPPPEPMPERAAASPPPQSSPDDPFADLGLPARSATAPTPPGSAPRPPAPEAARPGPLPKAARKPVVKSTRATPPRIKAPREEDRPTFALAPVLTGAGVFFAGTTIAVLLTIQMLGTLEPFHARPLASVPPVVRPVETPAVTVSPEPAPEPVAEPEVPPTVEVEVPPTEIPAPATGDVAGTAATRRSRASSAPHRAPPRARRPESADGSIPGSGATSEPPVTAVFPVRVIHAETPAPAPAVAPAPEPATPAPKAELGVLCGLVSDTDGRPVAGAQVMMADVGVVVLTDRAGRFCLAAPAGARTLSIVALGFTPSRRLVSLEKRTPELSVMLETAAPFPTPH